MPSVWILIDERTQQVLKECIVFCTLPVGINEETENDVMARFLSKIQERLEETKTPLWQHYLNAAQGLSEDDLEVDDNAIVAFGDDVGAYVQAWKWVPGPNPID